MTRKTWQSKQKVMKPTIASGYRACLPRKALPPSVRAVLPLDKGGLRGILLQEWIAKINSGTKTCFVTL